MNEVVARRYERTSLFFYNPLQKKKHPQESEKQINFMSLRRTILISSGMVFRIPGLETLGLNLKRFASMTNVYGIDVNFSKIFLNYL